MEKFQDIIEAVIAGEASKTEDAVRRKLDSGVAPMEIINEGLIAGLNVVGERYSTGEMFVPEMMVSAIAARGGMDLATEGMKKGEYQTKGTMVIGTVKGDLHNVGKNLVALVLRARGFKVIDLGVDVDKEAFISVVREYKPEFLGMSCLMTTTMRGMKDVIVGLTEAGLRDTVRVLVGGCPVTQEFATQIGADYYRRDAGSVAVLLEETRY